MSTYYTNDASIEVPPGFDDRSVQALVWQIPGGGQLALTVQRVAIRGDSAAEHAALTMAELTAGLRDFVLDETGVEDTDDAALRVCRFTGDQGLVLAVHGFVLLAEHALWLMAVAPPIHRKRAEELVRGAIESVEARRQ